MNDNQQRIASGQNAANTADARALDIGAAAVEVRSSEAPNAEAFAAFMEASARGMHAAANGMRSAAPLQTLDAPAKHCAQALQALGAAERTLQRLPITPATDELKTEAAALGRLCGGWSGVIRDALPEYTEAATLRRAFVDMAAAFAALAALAEDRAMQRHAA